MTRTTHTLAPVLVLLLAGMAVSSCASLFSLTEIPEDQLANLLSEEGLTDVWHVEQYRAPQEWRTSSLTAYHSREPLNERYCIAMSRHVPVIRADERFALGEGEDVRLYSLVPCEETEWNEFRSVNGDMTGIDLVEAIADIEAFAQGQIPQRPGTEITFDLRHFSRERYDSVIAELTPESVWTATARDGTVDVTFFSNEGRTESYSSDGRLNWIELPAIQLKLTYAERELKSVHISETIAPLHFR